MASDLLDTWLTAWNSHDGSHLADAMTSDGIYVDVPWGRVLTPATVANHVALGHKNSSDSSVRSLSFQRDGARYAFEWEMVGTNDGPIARGLPASGRPWTIHGASIGMTDGDRIKVHRDYWDLLGWLAQLGVSLPPQVHWVLTDWAEEPGVT
jgi:steroid delta-isomerase-like uncharacterized protein